MKKYSCPICYEKFRHYYLYIGHLKDIGREEIKMLIKLKKKERSPHWAVYRKILDRCDKRIESMRSNI